jgi:hypothetical protein
MKKVFIVTSVLLLFLQTSYEQSLVTRNIFSINVKDSIPIKIWLPKNYSNSKQYPVVYEFVYDHTDYIAATASNIWDIPEIIVVFAQIKPGNDYMSPNLSDIGQKYYAFVKEELLNYISKEYSVNNFRIAAGLSQGADYVNYILRNDPSLFKSYLIFSTEYPIYYKPNFSLYTAKIKDSLSYYIAIANDTKERIDFANQLFDSLKTSPYLNIKKQSFATADHPYSILYASPEALLFVFDGYNRIRPRLSNESLLSYYKASIKEKQEKYGNFNYHNIVSKISLSVDIQKDSTGAINAFLDTVFFSKEYSDIDFLNIGYAFRQKKLYESAERAYRMAILKNEETGRINLTSLSIYVQLFRVYDMQNKTKDALRILLDGFEKTKEKDEGLLYLLGYYYIDKKIDIKKGIEILKSVQNEKHMFSGFLSKPSDEILSKIATGYWELKDKKQSMLFVNKALELNPQNETALKLKASIE